MIEQSKIDALLDELYRLRAKWADWPAEMCRQEGAAVRGWAQEVMQTDAEFLHATQSELIQWYRWFNSAHPNTQYPVRLDAVGAALKAAAPKPDIVAVDHEGNADRDRQPQECGACDKPGDHCANPYGICTRLAPSKGWAAYIDALARAGCTCPIKDTYVARHNTGCVLHLPEQPQPDLDALRRDAARYRWLRDGHAYAPEEECIRGGKELDDLCDAAMNASATNGE